MATLEKIRNKSVLLFIIIIVALLAFILGDFLTSGRTYFGHPTTVATAGDATVDYTDYQARLSQAGEQLRQQGRDVSNDVLTQNVISQLLTEKLLDNEYNDLGITVTDRELTEALVGDNPTPQAQQMVAYLAGQLNLPDASGATVFDAMKNPAKYNLPAQIGDELHSIWAQQEKATEEQMLNQKFMKLVTGLYTYNKLDAKEFYDDNATTRTIAYVAADASAVSDDDIEVSDADVEKLWKADKEKYRLDEPMTEINYIYVSIEPSQADRLAAQQTVENAIMNLNLTAGTEAVASDTKFNVTTNRTTLANIRNAKLRDSIEAHQPGYAFLLSRGADSYTIAKLIDKSADIDSINISLLARNDNSSIDNIDSLVNAINAGTKFPELANDKISVNDSIKIALDRSPFPENLNNVLKTAQVGKAFVYTDSVAGQTAQLIYRVNKRNAPVTYYEVATIEYTVDPSQETLTDLTSALRTYVSNNSSAKDFTDNALEAGYSILSDQVGASSTGIGNARESRKFIKWAMENKKGKVSPMLQDDRQTYLIALAVMDKYDDYMPASSPAISQQLKAQARNNKKAEKLMADYQGKASDLAGYAQAMGKEVEHGNVNITMPALLNVGLNESALHGAIAAADKGQFVGPVKGNRGIMVFEVEGINTDNRPFSEEEYGQRFNQTFGLMRLPSPLPLLLGKDKVENRSLNFIQAVGE